MSNRRIIVWAVAGIVAGFGVARFRASSSPGELSPTGPAPRPANFAARADEGGARSTTRGTVSGSTDATADGGLSPSYPRRWMNPDDPSYDPVKTMNVAPFDIRELFLSEPRDNVFALAREKTVREVIAPAFERAVPGAKFSGVECHTHTCVIDLDASSDFARFAAQQLPWAEIVVASEGTNGNLQLLTVSSPGGWSEADGALPHSIATFEAQVIAEREAWVRERGPE